MKTHWIENIFKFQIKRNLFIFLFCNFLCFKQILTGNFRRNKYHVWLNLFLVALKIEEVEHLHGADGDQCDCCSKENFVDGSACESKKSWN